MKGKIWVVRTTVGQEKNVVNLISQRVKMKKIPIKAILSPETVRGYIFIEAEVPHLVDEAINGIRHVRARVKGNVSLEELKRLIERKPIVEEVEIGDLVEIISGPFNKMKAKIVRINKQRKELTLELLEPNLSPFPIKIHSESVRIIERKRG